MMSAACSAIAYAAAINNPWLDAWIKICALILTLRMCCYMERDDTQIDHSNILRAIDNELWVYHTIL